MKSIQLVEKNSIMETQAQMYYRAAQTGANCDKLFLDFVKGGLTRTQLKTNIDRRPWVWEKYSHWLDKLPD